ncbi:oligopeptide/dipeptide ABC transporter,ATP-binding, C-terminal domain protein [Pseudarthrobacter siccitolerans]|uniref:Oligopeptide/dipeptide ABC transporter,ATP-binding, C-terminal domain protein n=1 Tax=Pseudarthrobacter siccitolerans TaxID=861266 RepID=A0A024H654_9MICC|nr:ABC transporter ATP-binding protein [Pseudarthrobacter siccitolerans]CCQ47221.1 oligopeptide/dipeptide ABC transporter,ATP-binding, C-terminal domain protein [Pseudarthrobacter siccitolerans]
MSTTNSGPLLSVQDLTIEVTGDDGPVRLVDGVTFEVRQDEVFALVGESGSGKSLTVLAIMDLLPPGVRIASGRILFRGRDLARLPEAEMRGLRGKDLAMVFQDPMSALNPLQCVGRQLAEAVRLHASGLNRKQTADKVHSLLAAVGVPDPEGRAASYPHQWSGGMRQRAMIAMAMAHDPGLLIADEPTTALDVTVQAQVMDVLAQARRRAGSAMILITHDLGLVAEAADRVAVMYSGRVVETAHVHQLFSSPAHPYTAGLLASILGEGTAGGRAFAIPGSPPAAAERPAGCAFQPRCHLGSGREECSTARPVLTLLPTPPAGADGPAHPGNAAPGSAAACHFAGESTLHLLKGQPA